MVNSPPPGINDDITDNTPFEALSEKSLTAAGLAYLIGDAALYVSGKLSNRKDESGAGLWWLAGGIGAATFGNPSAEKQLQLLSKRLGAYLQKQGVEIPDNPDTQSLRQKGGVLDQLESFMYTYPSQILNTAYTIGGLLLIRSGVRDKNLWNSAAGALVVGGALAGLMMSEKKPDPNHPPEGFIEKTKAWFQEKPLRLPAIAYGLNDVMLAVAAHKDMHNPTNNGGYYFKFVTVATYAFGNIMLALSSKSHAGSNASMNAMQKLAETSARVVAAQPPQLREALLQQISGFLASQPEAHLKAEEIAALLHNKLSDPTLRVTQGNWQQHLNSRPVSPTTPSV